MYIYLAVGLFIPFVTLHAQNMLMFSRATQSGWYPHFLNPVVEMVTANPSYHQILDIGTGPGTLPQLLIQKKPTLEIIGSDIDTAMIHEAQKRFSHKNVSFQYQKPNSPIASADEQYDVVVFCSVLFLVDDSVRYKLMNEAMRVLKSNGKVMILTPSGEKSIMSSFVEIWRYPFTCNNFTFPIWKIATTRRGRKWQKQQWLENYANEHNLKYTMSLTFNNNATIETISTK
jgi:2-polyprenyl-3-methyl-5-hydroxy-6-metoxy-1,4-benzoquinol methylase